jgi:DNA-directed RNA polymerase subunit RPC12/RpoP
VVQDVDLASGPLGQQDRGEALGLGESGVERRLGLGAVRAPHRQRDLQSPAIARVAGRYRTVDGTRCRAGDEPQGRHRDPAAGGVAGPLKTIPPFSDWEVMARNEVECPICQADIPLAGDEKAGDEIYCTVCGAPILLKGDPKDEDLEVEPDF